MEGDLSELLEDMEHGCALMTDMVEQLRGHVRQDEQRELVPFSVEPAIQRALSLVGPQARKLVGTIGCEIEPGMPHVLLDPGKLQQVLVNLTINAAQACEGRADTRVGITAGCVGDTVTIAVSDNGCGIPQHALTDIFDPFYTTKAQGTGLGLWICHDTVAELGGRLEVDSEEGVGTVFTISLPVFRGGVPG